MKRNLNYTGRKDFDRSEVDVRLVANGGIPHLNIDWGRLDLDGLEGADLVIEVQTPGQEIRMPNIIDYIAAPRVSIPIPTLGPRPTVRLKFVKTIDQIPRILAVVDQITAESATTASSSQGFFPVRYQPDLGIPWTVNFDSEYPELRIHSNGGIGHALMHAPQTKALVLAGAIEQVARWCITLDDEGRSGVGAIKWRKYFERLGVSVLLSLDDKDPEERGREINEQVLEISRRWVSVFGILESLEEAILEEINE